MADLYRSQGKEKDTISTLTDGMDKVGNNPVLQHTLGLAYVRQRDYNQALAYLSRAVNHSNSPARYHYVYAIALNSTGQPKQALKILEQALEKFPLNVELLSAAISINLEIGNDEKAQYFQNLLNDDQGE